MTRKTVRIAMNGVTGRMGYRQHLVRSILAIREQGGLDLGDGTVLWPEPILVGRREHALKALAEQHGLDPANVSTDVDAVLADPTVEIYFDAQVTWDRTLSPSVSLGVTTAVMGNCGFGIAPCPARLRETMLKNLSVVEGMDLEALMRGTRWDFETFDEYLDALDRPITTPDDVRSVVITLATESVFDVPRAPVTVFSTRVRLRNR